LRVLSSLRGRAQGDSVGLLKKNVVPATHDSDEFELSRFGSLSAFNAGGRKLAPKAIRDAPAAAKGIWLNDNATAFSHVSPPTSHLD
jgi:hypothetical protein